MAKNLKWENVDVTGEKWWWKANFDCRWQAESLAISLSKSFECWVFMERCKYECRSPSRRTCNYDYTRDGVKSNQQDEIWQSSWTLRYYHRDDKGCWRRFLSILLFNFIKLIFINFIVNTGKLLSVLASKLFMNFYQYSQTKGISLVNHRKILMACIRSVLLYGSETWQLSIEDLPRIKRCDHAMIHRLYNFKIEQNQSTEDLRRRIHVYYIQDILRWNRLGLSGHLY